MTLARAIDGASPDAIALVDAASGERLSYGSLSARTKALAEDLAARGVIAGDRVAVIANGSARTFELLIACSRLGAILAPLNVRLADPELLAIVESCSPRVVFADDAHDARVRALGIEPGASRTTRSTRVHSALILLYTSGTTGAPKGALLTEASVAANAASTRRAWDLTASDVALVDAPLFHTGGLNVLATPLLYAGGTVVVAPRFNTTISGELLVGEGCTIAFGVPTMLERLVSAGVVERSRVRLWVTGGAPCPRALFDAFRNTRLIQGFGMTECGPNCFRPIDAAIDSIGTPTFDLEARLSEAGDLELRGPHVFAGYFENDEATRAAFTSDGWLRTGDVMRRDGDAWFVVGRSKEMFISGGENVYPAEIEIALAHHELVAECAVIGVSDPKWGEAGVAFVILRAGSRAPDETELRAFLRARLAGYKVPRTFVVREELPRTTTGKIDKRALANATC